MEYIKKYWKFFLLILFIGIFFAIATKNTVPNQIGSVRFHTAYGEISYRDFLEHLKNQNVEQVEINSDDSVLKIKLYTDENITYRMEHPEKDGFKEMLLLNDVRVVSTKGTLALPILFFLIGAVIAGILFAKKRMHMPDLFQPQSSSLTNNLESLEDIAGNQEAKQMVSDVIRFIRTPEAYHDIGAKMPRGLLFYGPPGTGKTLLARAVAREAQVPFYAISGSDFVQMYVGVGAKRVRELFSRARKSQKAVIFIDEIDALGKKRGNGLSASNDERDQTLNALLTEMSGFQAREGIVVIAATNRLDTLDEALLRPGRFDRHIEIGLPDKNARRNILFLHAANKHFENTADLEAIASAAVGFSGAMLETLLNEAAICAANAGLERISARDLDRAFYTVLAGAPKEDTSAISIQERRLSAYHEAGHALLTRLLLPGHTVSKVTIIPSTKGAGGFSYSIPDEKFYQQKNEILSTIKMLLGGRAAEELIFGSDAVTSGAENDIGKATKLAEDYLFRYGMDEDMGLIALSRDAIYQNTAFTERLCSFLNNSYEEAKQCLAEHQEKLHFIAEALLEQESLSAEDLSRLGA